MNYRSHATQEYLREIARRRALVATIFPDRIEQFDAASPLRQRGMYLHSFIRHNSLRVAALSTVVWCCIVGVGYMRYTGFTFGWERNAYAHAQHEEVFRANEMTRMRQSQHIAQHGDS